MADSTLAMGYLDFLREAGKFLGYGTDETNYSTAKKTDLDTLIDAGYRQALYPPILPNDRVPYRWKFLNPTTTITIVSGTGDYDLPDDFDGLDGPMRYSGTTYTACINFTGRDHILALRQADSSGIPTQAAITPREVNGTSLARWTIMFWPEPAGAYTLVYRYRKVPHRLSEAQPYPVGNVAFCEMLKESILAKCEEAKNDMQGVHRQAFVERLAACVREEQSSKAPDTWGMMMDPSTETYGLRRRDYSDSSVTYLGVAD